MITSRVTGQKNKTMHYFNYTCVLFIILLAVSVIYCEVIMENQKYEDLVNVQSFTNQDKEQFQELTVQIPDEKWITEAVKDIAYFLRNHKFNEWDRRYFNKKPKDNLTGYFRAFPDPSLRSLHWKVHENCYENFYNCIIYLHSVIETPPFTKHDDITTILNEKSASLNDTMIKKLDSECNDALLNADRTGLPFDGPVKKFQWRTTASYFMCWYTMLGTPALSMLSDACDNFAYCLDPTYGLRNNDPRADDKLSFACATYSFCPDPCCPMKHVKNMQQCYKNVANPCFLENNNTSKIMCKLDRKDNQNLEDIISNKWNITCNCKESGFIWKPQFEMCVDINECLSKEHNCDNVTEDCLNLPGTFICLCKWGFALDNNTSKCIETNIFNRYNQTLSKRYYYDDVLDILKCLLEYFGF